METITAYFAIVAAISSTIAAILSTLLYKEFRRPAIPGSKVDRVTRPNRVIVANDEYETKRKPNGKEMRENLRRTASASPRHR